MATTLETYVDIVNETLNFGFNDGPQVNRGRIERWVNEGQFQIARQVEAPEFQSIQTITMVKGKYKYALPEDYLRTQDIYYPFLTTRLRQFDLQQFDQVSSEVEGPPALYTIYSTELWLFPTSNSEDKLEHRYIKNAPILKAEADVPLLNKNYLHLLVQYAVTRAFEAEDDLEAAQAHKSRFKEDLDAFASDVQARLSTDRPRVIDGTWQGTAYGSRGVY